MLTGTDFGVNISGGAGTVETVYGSLRIGDGDYVVLPTSCTYRVVPAGGDPLLRGLYDEADATGFDDEQVLRALGVRTSVAALLDEPGGAAELLDRLADPDREVTGTQLHALYSGDDTYLSSASSDPFTVTKAATKTALAPESWRIHSA